MVLILILFNLIILIFNIYLFLRKSNDNQTYGFKFKNSDNFTFMLSKILLKKTDINNNKTIKAFLLYKKYSLLLLPNLLSLY